VLCCLVPLAIIILSNATLITTLLKRRKKFAKNDDQNAHKFDKMNKVVISITILFLIFTVPASIPLFFISIFFTDEGRLATQIIDCFSFSYYALNFFITYFSNNLFRKEVKKFLTINMKGELVSSSTRPSK
jgi:hypothetical protein